jgi:hypothetical protein
MKLTRVDELIDPNTDREEEAEAILTIPNKEGMPDWPAWHFDSKGLFSVNRHTSLLYRFTTTRLGRQLGRLWRGA